MNEPRPAFPQVMQIYESLSRIHKLNTVQTFFFNWGMVSSLGLRGILGRLLVFNRFWGILGAKSWHLSGTLHSGGA